MARKREGRYILVAVDLTDHSASVVAAASEAARAFGGELLLAHVVHDLASLFGVYVSDQPVGSLQEDLLREAQERLSALARDCLEREKVACRTRVLRGTPWTEIVGCALESEADLIVIGSHVARRPVHDVLGSTAERILRDAPCPVLVVPPRRTRTEP